MDGDTTMRAAVRESFPEALTRSCYFHIVKCCPKLKSDMKAKRKKVFLFCFGVCPGTSLLIAVLFLSGGESTERVC